MRTYLPWIVAVLAAVAAWFFHRAGQHESAEVARLQQAVHDLEGLRDENAILKTNQVSQEEVEQLRKDKRDLIRLRNEVGQLRKERQQLVQQAATAQAAAQQSATQVQAAQVQVQTLASNAAYIAQAPPPEMLEAFRRRYGIELTPSTPEQQRSVCIQHLRTLTGAKMQWALEHQKSEQTIPTALDLLEYIKGGIMPACPAGGSYTLGRVAENSTCSMPGHVIPEQ